MRLTGHRPDPAHLPHQPLIDGDAVTLALAVKAPGLAGKVLQDRAAFEDRDRLAVRPLGIGDGGHPVVRCDLQEIGRELVPRTDVDEVERVGQPHLLKRDGDFPAVRRGPVV